MAYAVHTRIFYLDEIIMQSAGSGSNQFNIQVLYLLIANVTVSCEYHQYKFHCEVYIRNYVNQQFIKFTDLDLNYLLILNFGLYSYC